MYWLEFQSSMTSPFTTTVSKIQRFWHLFLLFVIIITYSYGVEAEDNRSVTNVGAIISVNSRIGRQQKTAMEIAAKNFNNHSKNHKIVLHFQDSTGDPLLAAFSAEELIKEKKVKLLMGMETWQEAALVANIGNQAQVPVISFAAPTMTSPLMQYDWPFLIRVASDGAAEMKCIADIVSLYIWKRVIVIYQDDGYGGDAGMLTLLSEALQDVGSQIEHHLVLPRVSSMTNPNWDELENILKLLSFQSRVFIVLPSSIPAVTNLLRVAKKMGLVGKDSAWIITESTITSLLGSQIIHDMEGTIGIKSYYDKKTSSYVEFSKVFQEKFSEDDNSKPGSYALRAYDLTRIVTQAISSSTNTTANLQVLHLLNSVLQNYTGLSGEIHFKGGEVLYSPTFRIINIVEGNRYQELHFWRPETGFSESLAEETSQKRRGGIGTVIWPGNLSERAPKGWGMPTSRKPMRIVVPGGTTFGAFVNVDLNKTTQQYDGFCIQIFHKVQRLLDYPLLYEFHAFNGSYDDMVELVYNKTFDAAVGDFTILAHRLDKVEFTHPYIESDLTIIASEKAERPSIWMFIKPLTWQMWAMSAGILLYTILIIWFLEYPSNPEFSGPLKTQIGTATWFTFTSLFSAQREKIHNNFTRVVVVMWLFVVLILTSSYTANLSSMLTIQQLKPDLMTTNPKVGVDGNPFLLKYLQEVLGFKMENLIEVNSEYSYVEALKNRSITFIVDESPYAKVFRSLYNCKGQEYTTISPHTFRLGGLGFMFQKGSPFARDFSKVILELLENGELKALEDTWLTPNPDCPNNPTSDAPKGLDVNNFMGLYVIFAVNSTICFLSSLIILLKKFHRHQKASGGNASDESAWNRTVRIARFLYKKEFSFPRRAPSFADVQEMTSSQEEHATSSIPHEHQLQTSTPAQTGGSPSHE